MWQHMNIGSEPLRGGGGGGGEKPLELLRFKTFAQGNTITAKL